MSFWAEGASGIRASLRKAALLGLDGGLAAVAFLLALYLRFEGSVPDPWRAQLAFSVTLLVSARVVSSALFRLHRWSFRFSGLTDGARVALAAVFGTGLFLLMVYLLELKGPPRSVVLLELLLSMAAMALLRFSPRLAWMYRADRLRARRSDGIRTLIVGAGAAGEALLRDLARSEAHAYRVLGFVDDDAGKWGVLVGGKPVLGPLAALPGLVARHAVGNVLIAIPRLAPTRLRELLSTCAHLTVQFKTVPVSFVHLTGKRGTPALLTDLAPEDLLARPPVRFSESARGALLRGRSALVTGAAGSIGSEIVEQLLAAGVARLALVDHNENGLYLLARRLERRFPGVAVAAEVADVRDAARTTAVFERHRPQDVFHAAAHKHVPLMEAAPCEAVKNNVLGTRHVADAADRFAAERFVFISTDKAVRPTSVMGATKRVGEMLVRHKARTSRTKFAAVRFGNVLDSAGSVVPLFREQIAAGGPVTVTHPDVRRYFMTVGEAVGLVLGAAYGDAGSLYILDMGEQIRIADLARYMITMSGASPDEIPIAFTGLRPGEKLFEELLTEDEERTELVDQKIQVVDAPPPPDSLERQIDELAQLARAEKPDLVVAALAQLVPSYRPSSGTPFAAKADGARSDERAAEGAKVIPLVVGR